MKFINYGKQKIDKRDKLAVYNSLNSERISSGPYVEYFESKIKKYVSSKYSIVCNSGTSALHIALFALNIKKNDIVVMPAINFIAAYNLCTMLQAKIYLSDVNSSTGQMEPKDLEVCIKKNKLKKIKTVIISQIGGHPEHIIDFHKLKKKYKFFLLEDSCHSFGAKYKYKNKYYNVGSCRHSDIATFSFHPLKSITTGEGGAITTNNSIIAKKCKLFRSHGIVRKKNHWDYDVLFSGLNYRISDINCALGISQIKKINEFINYRKKISILYQNFFTQYSNLVKFPKYSSTNISSWHLYLISIDFKKLKLKKSQFIRYFLNKKIMLQFHYIPIYHFTIYKKKNKKISFKGAEKYYSSVISLPIHCNLKIKEIEYIIEQMKIFFKKYKK